MPAKNSPVTAKFPGMGAGRMLQSQIAPAPFTDRYTRLYGSQLTPQTFTGVLNNASYGYMWALADCLDEIRERDTHLHSCLTQREMRVTGTEWEMRPPAGKGKQAQNIADWCKDRLLEIESTTDMGRSFDDALADMMGGLYQGRSVHEAIWTNEGRYWYPKELEFVHARRCAYTSDWRLHLWDASGTNTSMWMPPIPDTDKAGTLGEFPGLPVAAFPAGKFIAHRPRVRGVYPTREGLGPLVAWYSLFKRFDIRDWLGLAEWVGRGLKIGTYASGRMKENPGTASDQDVQELKAILDSLSSAVSAVVPDTTKIDVVGMPATNDVHEKLAFFCNSEMSKATLLQTLTTEVGVTGGNRALGEVHNTISEMLAMQDAKQIARTVKRDLIRPMVVRSFGENAPVPEMVFDMSPDEDKYKLAAMYVALAGAGLEIGQDFVREQLGIAEPTAGEEKLSVAVSNPEKDPGKPGDKKDSPKGSSKEDVPNE